MRVVDSPYRYHSPITISRGTGAPNDRFEKLVLPNEIHGFLRHASWLRADEATAEFLARTLVGQ